MKTNAQWNRFDICQAWYLFACEWHRGQWSKEYAIFGRLARMQFRPAMGFGRESLNYQDSYGYYEYQNTRDILAGLIRRYRRKGM